ncbi:hypothetical protein EOA32_29780 [Mesorhizobium sp. M1A.F.Ca.ET.072.01.1.1]|uniref:hypothetical protein n=1 Tax=Mesorhizobium sp. M1A.F.Ca.ET.072.01.1.1 TaxID=2496753 RepID=UPI000FD19415|nr:hypothetical protein [Mesorhizobium sp. M1A.F.Ca.ET.072.01.1.1]RUW47105.1 hypothetical protein EOA32_29780 [Mesorhizobium sp. M1A.F.Ca.ET.072.01.1.1]TIV02576.1 MAG: hypothetical protein E5W04_12700 [Mesorhizobium sp.]
MNWWIGSCWVLASLGIAALDYRVQKLAAKRWLADWPWRLVMYFALGGVTTGVPVFLYRFGEAIIGVYSHPPTARMLVALLPLAVAMISAVQVLKMAERIIRGAGNPLRSRRVIPAVYWIAVALFLFAVAGVLLGVGFFGSFSLLRDR